MTPIRHLTPLLAMTALLAGCDAGPAERPPSPLAQKIRRYAPTVLTADTAALSAGDRQALGKLFAAARLVDRIYLRQVWSGNEALAERLRADQSPEGKERLRYFLINRAPWSRLDHNEPFVSGVPREHPPHASYYPDDMTREEYAAWLAGLPEQERKRATGFFTVIRRDDARSLRAVPYSEEYRDLLQPAAAILREAAALTTNASLRTYLAARADAFLSNDYYDSDVAWLNLDSPIDVTIGPYEVYMDELFNAKAAFEAFITLRDDQETARLALFSAHLQEIEDNLPIDARYKNRRLGALAPIRVVNEVGLGGEPRAGVQTAAFNLPNDERVLAEHGSKRVMLKNVQEAKFQKVLVPIASVAIDPSQQRLVLFQQFFTHILAHELVHGLGPHGITVAGRRTTVREALRDLSSAIEEAKADITGLYALQLLIDRGFLKQDAEQAMYATFLAGVFRSVRFGVHEAHGRGMALQFNYLSDEGAFEHNPQTGTFRVNFDRVKGAVRKLTAEILTIQARGDYEAAAALLSRYAEVRPPMQRTLNRVSAIPVDIAPSFPLMGEQAAD